MGTVSYEVADGIALVTIDRPDKLNALTLPMYDGLGCAFDRARDDDGVGVVVLTGAGDRAFCVGADLHESIPALADGRFDISHWDGAHQKHSSLHKPVVAAVNGLCLGGGFEIMLSTDLRICSERARFALPEAGVGVVPAGGTLVRLTRQVGYAHAMELLLLGDQVDAADAFRIGLVNRVVPHEQVLATALDTARRLLTRSGTALEVIKASVRQLADMPVEAAFHAEALYGQQAFASADAKEGLAAFAERRPPRFPTRAAVGS
ncbi:enoyl-CoA hydratase [Nocardioides silvaticus]|uniref:Enoyl-CoA hydratase n=1 Tax=Nocardioides silvaticus TaxID=2201891 RepID=A0A316TCC2_9ACTN|nr:enoyl-CoA hydratase/isomerase family protein [Nocardioides silvaticus]PWN01151.1 enoyl-CoA hydratase [Nocardioides silvaticus]